MVSHLPLHLRGPAYWSLEFVGGLATWQFRVTVCQGLRGIRRDLGALVAERVAFHLSSGGCTTASAHFCAGLASIAEEEEAGTGQEQNADDAADDDAGNGA